MALLLKKATVSYLLSLALYTALIATLLTHTLWIDPPPGSIYLIALFQIIPLALPLYGLLKKQPRASAWLCFIICFYFIGGILEAWFSPTLFYGWLLTSFSTLLFITAMLFTRWQGKINQQQLRQALK